eukprot:CAMPEP_0117763200 /NCGR_PEP_ID=MMETSP0947-20121206/18478_1 /TAXON_ID=44440 /ORGANISM="Chattonella subsalsa, Strain CCMP2191" /LENGTH=341 /DNA_ID=CAMNT_0005584825 /DNA_START=175 /DNA_END=1197 /DNA_ORIENTATION=-
MTLYLPFEKVIPSPILRTLRPSSRKLYDSILETPSKYSQHLQQLSCRNIGIISSSLPKSFIYGGVCLDKNTNAEFIVPPHHPAANCRFTLLLPQHLPLWFESDTGGKFSNNEKEQKLVVLLFCLSPPEFAATGTPWELGFMIDQCLTILDAFVMQAIHTFTRDAKWEKLLRGMDLAAMDLPCPFRAVDLMYLLKVSSHTPLSDLEEEVGCRLPSTDCKIPWRELFEDLQEKYPYPSLIFYDTNSQCHIIFRCPLVVKSQQPTVAATSESGLPKIYSVLAPSMDGKMLNDIVIYVCLGPPSSNSVSVSVLQRAEHTLITADDACLSAITDFINMVHMWCWDR